MYTVTIQFERWVQIDTWRQVQQDEESLAVVELWKGEVGGLSKVFYQFSLYFY